MILKFLWEKIQNNFQTLHLKKIKSEFAFFSVGVNSRIEFSLVDGFEKLKKSNINIVIFHL